MRFLRTPFGTTPKPVDVSFLSISGVRTSDPLVIWTVWKDKRLEFRKDQVGSSSPLELDILEQDQATTLQQIR
jgi:hypothetical protein